MLAYYQRRCYNLRPLKKGGMNESFVPSKEHNKHSDAEYWGTEYCENVVFLSLCLLFNIRFTDVLTVTFFFIHL